MRAVIIAGLMAVGLMVACGGPEASAEEQATLMQTAESASNDQGGEVHAASGVCDLCHSRWISCLRRTGGAAICDENYDACLLANGCMSQ
ncbi:hypothetical protein D7V93_00685 [Corallococcus llansteffanensis]|uniref:Lipoprotein n=1 Tax=Corallococcus llansteffanensis TaxID=2316731 RepID=A0A3A8QJM9_9BACT|nr:hypothetical protein D7V93_00685 [Corallococcus llansteffanensis]